MSLSASFAIFAFAFNLKEKLGYAVRYIVCFDEEVDGEALKRAFESTMKRYPYLRLKLVKGLFSDSGLREIL